MVKDKQAIRHSTELFQWSPIMAITCEEYDGYCYHPIFDTVVVAEDGRVLNLKTGEELKQTFNGIVPYYQVNVPGYGSRLVHRLVAETYLPCLGDFSDFQVNHKNGNKTTNNLSNLEWVTVSENMVHAYTSGLRTDNRPVYARDLETEKELSFYSLSEAARYFKVNGEKIHRWLNSRKVYPFLGKWNLKYGDGEWKLLDSSHIGLKAYAPPVEILLFDHNKSSGILFNSSGDASRYLGVTREAIRAQANKFPKVDFKGFHVYFRNDFENEVESILDKRTMESNRKIPVRKPLRVLVKDLLTLEEKEWDSLEAFAISVTAKKNTVQKSIFIKNGRWKNYHIIYLDKPKSPSEETLIEASH